MSKGTHWINGEWLENRGSFFFSCDPGSGAILWEGSSASSHEVELAATSAQHAFSTWSASSFEERSKAVLGFIKAVSEKKSYLATLISQETGKPLWESLEEVSSTIELCNLAIKEYHVRQRRDREGFATGLRPYGALAVLTPFSLPLLLPCSYIIPALLTGNTVVFKPSELVPLTAEKIISLWEAQQLPKGVLNLLQGEDKTGKLLATDSHIDGLLFSGGSRAANWIKKKLSASPHKLLHLEQGGNNPILVHQVHELKTAAYLTAKSAFASAGQRCTCATRIILVDGQEGDAFLQELITLTSNLKVGRFDELPEPFMGPVISPAASQRALKAQKDIVKSGGKIVLEMKKMNALHGSFLTPGIVDITEMKKRPDEEVLAPLLQLVRVANLEEGIIEASRAAYAYAAGIFTDDENAFKKFLYAVKAELICHNKSLTGKVIPPSSLTYCSYPYVLADREKLTALNNL